MKAPQHSLGDRVVYRSVTNQVESFVGVIENIRQTATPYGVKLINKPYNATKVWVGDESLSATSKLFAKCMIVGKQNSTLYFWIADKFAACKVENNSDVLNRKPDILLFTGGEDVNPYMYGSVPHQKTFFNTKRDSREAMLYRAAKKAGIPCVGICRGAQFLNVMNGGKLVQHVTNHTSDHEILTSCNHKFEVTSTHHQMMDVHESAEILAWSEQRSEVYEGLPSFNPLTHENKIIEPEVVLYRNNRDLCVQYHPETMAEDSQGIRYFLEILKELNK